jgi:ABC-type uncharacterized transport system permease subunit
MSYALITAFVVILVIIFLGDKLNLSGWKTRVVGFLTALFGLMQGMNWTVMAGDPQTAGWVIAGIGVSMLILRELTKGPAGKKPS